MCNTVEELKGVIDDDGRLDRYLDGMKGNNEDEETFENPIGDAGTEIIDKGLSYWDNKSNCDSDEDNGDPISSYDDLFGFNDDEPQPPLIALFNGNGVDFGSPDHTMNDVGMVGHDSGHSTSQLMEIPIENEVSKEQLAPMVSEQVVGLTETHVMEADDNENVTIDIQPLGEKAESELVRDEGNGSNLKPVQIESVNIDGTAE